MRLPLCLNRPAARSHLPLTFNQTEMAFSGMAKTQMFDRTKTAFDKSELPVPEPGSYSPQPITEFVISASKWSDGTAAYTNVH